jgi:hypothetical protein
MMPKTSHRYRVIRVATTLIVMAGLLLLGASLTAQTPLAQASDEQGLEGTWRVQVTLYNCAASAAGATFRSLLSFAPGGTLTEATASPAFQPGQRGPGHGIWSHTGAHSYRAVSEAFILFATAPNPPAPGFQRGTQRITQQIEVNKDQFTAVASIQFLDDADQVVTTGCARASGQRFTE